MVFADGILLSNYLGNGPANAPRWMLVTPEEIERVDVLYGLSQQRTRTLGGRGGGLCHAHADEI